MLMLFDHSLTHTYTLSLAPHSPLLLACSIDSLFYSYFSISLFHSQVIGDEMRWWLTLNWHKRFSLASIMPLVLCIALFYLLIFYCFFCMSLVLCVALFCLLIFHCFFCMSLVFCIALFYLLIFHFFYFILFYLIVYFCIWWVFCDNVICSPWLFSSWEFFSLMILVLMDV